MTSQSTINPNDTWTKIIRPKRGLFDLRLRELWRARELIMLFVWRDFVSVYKQTILGPLWYFVQPVLSLIVFTVIFGNIAHLSTDGAPPFLFYMAGNTVWSYFNACVMSTSNTFVANAGIFGKVYFPRLSIPISVSLSNLISFSIRLVMFLLFWVYFMASGSGIHPTWWILILPVLMLIMALLGLGVGIIVSSLTTKYRDLQQLVGFGMQLLMYATPVIYPLSTITGIWRWVILANPMTPVVEVFRLAFLGVSAIDPISLWYSAGFAVVVFLAGVLIFNRVESTFMDTV
jgi:lipopolysaccharide transport system permease protein